jgi:hypothetical protein
MGNNTGNEIDSLFKVPIAEFTAVRNDLAKRLKKANREDEAEKVKAISKPSISAWAANQLYWNHRNEFKRLLEAGKQLAEAQASQLKGTGADVRPRITARREAVSTLLQLADALLRDGGHGATPDTLRRIETTLEALSTSTSIPGTPEPGRLTEDVAPLGFESLAALMPGGAPAKKVVDLTTEKLKDAKALVNARASELRQAEDALMNATAARDEAIRRAHVLHAELEKSERLKHDAAAALQKARAALDRLEDKQ